MIELIPAIDIIAGKCVRLTKGDYDQKTEYGEPLEMAREFERIGFKRLHMVDLDGAKSKHIVNSKVLTQVTSETSLEVDFGGGIKTHTDIEAAFDAGAQMVTVGSIAVTQPNLFTWWLQKYGPDRVDAGVKNVLCTEISKDGTLGGPAFELYADVMKKYPDLHLIASGGVSCIEDIKALEAIGVPAVVFGKAIYEGKIDLRELIKLNR